MARISLLLLIICTTFMLGQVFINAGLADSDLRYGTTITSDSVNYTGVTTDLAIMGDAFFRVRDSRTGEIFVTRYGSFRIDGEGYLVLFGNLRLQGFNKPVRYGVNYSNTDSIGDIRWNRNPPAGLPASAASSPLDQVIIGSEGIITFILGDGTAYIGGRIHLQEFEQPGNLRQKWQYFYTNLDAAKPMPIFSPLVSHLIPRVPITGTLRSLLQPIVKSGVLNAGFSRDWPGILLDRAGTQTTVWLPTGFGSRYELEASTDLMNWHSIATNRIGRSSVTTNEYGEFKFVDTASTHSAVRFYRVIGPLLKQTGKQTDLAIWGEGYFVVRDPVTGSNYVTRAGNFHLDAEKFLTTEQGMRVQGYNSSIDIDSDYSAESERGDIKLDKGTMLIPGLPSAEVTAFDIDMLGRIHILLSDGIRYYRGQILLQDFSNPFALKLRDGFMFIYDETAGPLPQPIKPTYRELGAIISGGLEFSRHTPFR